MKIIIKIFVLVLLPSLVMAQKKTYLGFDIGRKFDVYQSIDNGDALYAESLSCCPVVGINIGQEINKTFTFETGIYLYNYGGGFGIRNWGYYVGSTFLVNQIPLRLKANLNLIEDKLRLVSTVGYTFAINIGSGTIGSGNSISTTTSSTSGGTNIVDSTKVEFAYKVSQRKNYGLLETGIALEYSFKYDIIMYLAANYLTGFNRMVEFDINYSISGQAEQSGKTFSNGDYYSIFLGIRYPISNIWNKKSKN